jgi:hypothetical protein
LQNPDGSYSTTPDQLAHTLTSYFQSIFSTYVCGDRHTTICDHLTAHVANQTDARNTESVAVNNGYTNSILDVQELHNIIKNMRSNTSSRPEGLNAAFYKSAWTWVSQDIHTLVSDFYTSAFLQPELNQTFIALIPKKMQLVLPRDFRPFSLCKVISKVIAKSLTDRLKPLLSNYIDNS